MRWPTPQDYNEAIQNPSTNFDDQELKAGSIELDALGLPRPVTGAFASVYKVNCQTRSLAVRCFLRRVPDQQQRYRLISDFVLNDQLPYTVDFQFLDKGIRVNGSWYPILKMEWVDGLLLPQYIEKHLDAPEKLGKLERSFTTMIAELTRDGIAHGDLQHGNIMMVGDEIRLVDYDGMFVPALKSFASTELGHRNYQHPRRTAEDFGPHLDDFSAATISTALNALMIDPGLWNELNGGDECLLFRATDFQDPLTSRAFALLENHNNRTLRIRSRHLRSLLKLAPDRVPALADEISDPQDLELLPAWDSSPPWVRSQLHTKEEEPVRLKATTSTEASLPATANLRSPIIPVKTEKINMTAICLLLFAAPLVWAIIKILAAIGLNTGALSFGIGFIVFSLLERYCDTIKSKWYLLLLPGAGVGIAYLLSSASTAFFLAAAQFIVAAFGITVFFWLAIGFFGLHPTPARLIASTKNALKSARTDPIARTFGREFTLYLLGIVAVGAFLATSASSISLFFVLVITAGLLGAFYQFWLDWEKRYTSALNARQNQIASNQTAQP